MKTTKKRTSGEMGRRSKQRSMWIWVNGDHAAVWHIRSSGKSELEYTKNWSAADYGRPFSLSLPFNLDNVPITGNAVQNYFDNLLPDTDAIRQRIRERFHTPSSSAFDLLVAVGRDCVGALQLLPPHSEPENVKTIKGEALTEEQLERILIDSTSSHPLKSLHQEELRISIAGAQEKTAFLRHEERWCRPLGTTPTTHIFKLPLGLIGGVQADMSTSVENEWLCSKILQRFEIPVANCEIAHFEKCKALIVERFDRQLHSSGKYWLRLMQEDFCQATGLPASRKYESDGGPSMMDVCKVLRNSEQRATDLRIFLKAQILFWLLAAGDGHAKNFSIRLLSQGRYQLTPLYDVLSYYPIIGNGANKIAPQDVKMAMAFRGKNKHYAMSTIRRRHMNETAKLCGLGDSAEPLIHEILAEVPGAITDIHKNLPRSFPTVVAESILGGLQNAARKLAAMESQ